MAFLAFILIHDIYYINYSNLSTYEVQSFLPNYFIFTLLFLNKMLKLATAHKNI